MPTYPYHCVKCGQDTDIIKSMNESGRDEQCPICELQLERVWTVPYLTGTSVEDAEFNHALGVVTKNKKDRAEIAKQKGLVEVGNDYGTPERMQVKFDKSREESMEQRWKDVDKEVLNNE